MVVLHAVDKTAAYFPCWPTVGVASERSPAVEGDLTNLLTCLVVWA